MGRAHEVRAASMAKTAAMKSKLYSIYAKEIYKAAKDNPDPVNNSELKRIIDKAKKDNVPGDVINRNIDKVKKGEVVNYDVVEYEAFGPSGSTIIIKCLTDNTNRTLSEIKTVMNKCKGKLAGVGAVSYGYETFSVVGVSGINEEQIMDSLFNSGIDINDIEDEDGICVIYGEPQDLYKIKSTLENDFPNVKFEIDEISKFSKEMVNLSEEDMVDFKKIYDMLDELDDVSNIYHNVNM